MVASNSILITFDLEEFDLPLEYGLPIDKSKQLEISLKGVEKILPLLDKYNAKCTFFTTAYFAENNVDFIKKIAASGHEIASHLYYHSDYDEAHILLSKQKLEAISGQKVLGIRSPRLRELNPKKVKEAQYLYNSSLNPTYLPGRYNNFNAPRLSYFDTENQLIIVPFSVALIIRFPLFWLAFKNVNLFLYQLLCGFALKRDKVLHLYFHPWEFENLDEFAIPNYVKKHSGAALVSRLDKLLNHLQDKGSFCSVASYLKLT